MYYYKVFYAKHELLYHMTVVCHKLKMYTVNQGSKVFLKGTDSKYFRLLGSQMPHFLCFSLKRAIDNVNEWVWMPSSNS